jgi:DNA-directed RNA polymerase subunit RPC12/RpoP
MPTGVYYEPESRLRWYCSFSCGRWSYRAGEMANHEKKHWRELTAGDRCQMCGGEIIDKNESGMCRECLSLDQPIALCHSCGRHYETNVLDQHEHLTCPKCREKEVLDKRMKWVDNMGEVKA